MSSLLGIGLSRSLIGFGGVCGKAASGEAYPHVTLRGNQK